MKYGFTASRSINERDHSRVVYELLRRLDDGDVFITGACVGGDALIGRCAAEMYPDAEHWVIVPANRSQVDRGYVWWATKVIVMPRDTDYRARNERIVEESDRVIACYTGKKLEKPRSGTWMTANIARDAGKLHHVQPMDPVPVEEKT